MDVEVSDEVISSKELIGPGAEYQKILTYQCSAVANVINEIKQTIDGIENKSITKNKCIDAIKRISSEPDDSSWHIYGDFHFIHLVTYTLSHFELNLSERDWLCMEYVKFFWIHSHLMSKEGILIFYNQLEEEISEQTANAILEIILYIVLGSYTDVHTFIPDTVTFLKKHNDVSRRIFNTIIILSSSIKKRMGKEGIVGSIDLMKIAKKEGALIFEKYLYQGESLVLPASLENYNIDYLVRVFYSGISISEENKIFFKLVWQKIIKWTNAISNNGIIELSLGFICDFFNQEIRNKNGEAIIDIIFSDIEYKNLSKLSIRLFLHILDMSLLYYDSYNDADSRQYVWKFISSFENTTYEKIPLGEFKNSLVKSLLLVPSYDPCWLNQLTSYSDDDIDFLIDQYEKFYKQYPADVVYSLYGLNICKLLPRVIAYLEKAISVIVSYTIIPDNLWYVVFKILSNIVFCPEKEKIKSRNEYYSSMMRIFERLSMGKFPEISKLQEAFLENINQSTMNETNVGKTDENIR